MCWGKKSNILVSGSGDCTVKIWKGLNNNGVIRPIQCLQKQIDHNSHVNCLDFDHTNDYLAVGTEDGEVYIWHTKEFTLRKKYQINSSSITTINYSPDGAKLALGSKNKTLLVIDVATGLSVFTKTMKSPISSLRWNGFLLILGCDDGNLCVWDMVEVRLLYEANYAHSGAIKTVDIAADKSMIVTGSEDRLIKVWRPK